MCTTLGNQSEIGNVDRPGKTPLVRGVEDSIERDVFEDLVDPQLVRIEHHDVSWIPSLEKRANERLLTGAMTYSASSLVQQLSARKEWTSTNVNKECRPERGVLLYTAVPSCHQCQRKSKIQSRDRSVER